MIFFAYLGIIAVMLLTGYICRPFLPAFVWALVIYQAGLPLHRRLLKRFSSLRSSLLMLAIVLLTIIVPLSLISSQLVIEASSAYQRLEAKGFTAPSAESLQQFILSSPLPAPLRNYLAGENLEESLLVHAAQLGKTILSFSSSLLTQAAINIGSFIFSTIAFLFLYFFTCSEGTAWYQKIINAVPNQYHIEELLARLASGASGLFWGVAGTCIAQGIVGGLVFLSLGLPSPLLIAALITFCALIPVIGTAVIWVPFALWLAINGAWIKALILTCCGLFVIGSMDNITRPLLTKMSGAQLSPLTITLGAIGGISVFGLTGIVIGPLAIESFSWLLDRLGKEPATTE